MNRKLVLVVVAFILYGLYLPTTPASAQSGELVVNSAKDNINGFCDAAHCTLREAILQSNITAGFTETIKFDIDRFGDLIRCNLQTKVCTIKLKDALPTLNDPVVIDGYSQPSAAPNTLTEGMDTKLRIVLDGQDKSFDGLVVKRENTEIKGLALIHFQQAIVLKSNNARVTGNFIGMKTDGETVAENTVGILVKNGDENQIGGETPADRNLISGNHFNGINIQTSHNTTVQGNYIGTDKSGIRTTKGTADTGNDIGIFSMGSNFTIIGGDSAGARNVIAGNRSWGIRFGDNTVAGFAEGNYIGVGADGKFVLGNAIGIGVWGDFITNIQLTKNRIYFNRGIGVQIGGKSIDGVLVSQNRIDNNAGLGIDLLGDNVTANDANDTDSGPNGLQNFPVLTKVKTSVVGSALKGKLNSTPNTKFLIEFFTNKFCDPRGNGEGNTFVASTDVTTDAMGNAKISFQTNKSLLAGAAVTATATRYSDTNIPTSTSEYSGCRAVE